MKQIKIKAFGILVEKLPGAEFEIPLVNNTEELLLMLKKTYPELQKFHFSIAVNRELIQEKTNLNGEEEIALLPPFSGG